MLGELGYLTEDEEASHGELPAGLVESVREQVLRTEALTVALRGYQSFGARFALVQRKVILGDEMGLGKTIEALAVLAHLWATGATHFLVVCPPGVLVNWLREIAARSTLAAHRIHGPEWQEAAAAWVAGGGVAVTTYETTWMESGAWLKGPTIACVVVDEAQYVKNPEAQRSRRTATLVAGVERAILLTGTPMQNHVGEFRTLISYLQPGLVAGEEELAPRLFRRAIAPAYLRRNQEDVLAELPDLVEVEDWLPLGERDVAAYRTGVVDGNLMLMRRAAMLHGLDSPKVDRLVEIVEEAEDNGRRVIVYSYFNDVLAGLREVLTGPVFGPLDGSVAAGSRQRLVDEFSAAEGGAALLAQITTGGVGLNIQAASVVVLCEPQLNPALEAQAVARAHRMGQLQSVQVHRLLSEDAVDERIHELLAHKRQLFEEYAGTSVTADAAPEATDAEIARQVHRRGAGTAALRAAGGAGTGRRLSAAVSTGQRGRHGSVGIVGQTRGHDRFDQRPRPARGLRRRGPARGVARLHDAGPADGDGRRADLRAGAGPAVHRRRRPRRRTSTPSSPASARPARTTTAASSSR